MGAQVDGAKEGPDTVEAVAQRNSARVIQKRRRRTKRAMGKEKDE